MTVGEVEKIKLRNNIATYYDPHDEDEGAADAVRLAKDASRPDLPIAADFLTMTPDEPQGGLLPCETTPAAWRCMIKRTGLPAQDLPQRVTFVDPEYALKNSLSTTVGGEAVSDQLASILPFGTQPKIACDKHSKFCTAALLLSPKIVAVWGVWAGDERGRYRSPMEMAQRQGRVIATLAGGR